MKHSAHHAFDSEEVMAYLDGELDPSRAALLASHLEHCEECRALAAQFRQVSERLRDFEVGPGAESVGTAVLGAFDTARGEKKIAVKDIIPEKSREWRLILASPYTWAAAGAVFVALIVAGIPLTRSPGHQMSANLRPFQGGQALREVPMPLEPPPLNRGAQTAGDRVSGGENGAIEAPETAGPMIAQTASLTIVAANYEEASAAIDRLVAAQNGYVQKLTAEAQTGSSRQLSATLRVPAKDLDSLLAQLRKLGHVQEESRANDELTDQYVDLQARLKSARASEQRLLELLGSRTGKLEDVLDVERELARVRGEIESMEGQRIILAHRVDYATVEVQLQEEYHATLDSKSSSIPTRIWNAAVEGFGNLEGGVVAVVLFLLAYGPSVLLCLAILFVPARFLWQRFGPRPLSRA